MIKRTELLKLLPAYQGKKELLVQDQDVNDIMREMKKCHKEHAEEYDALVPYFLGNSPYQTCENIFNYLRSCSFYYIEGINKQTVRSPSAIIATGPFEGLDCKNYSLFAGGILDAINRSGEQKIPYVYRFASDNPFNDEYCHVFIVAFPGTNNEIFIDPIPPVKYFNQHLPYYSSQDEKFKAMALYKISGYNYVQRIPRTMGDLSLLQLPNFASGIVSAITSIFKSGKVSPDHWKGWAALDTKIGAPLGTNAINWIIYDGDSPSSEALNVLSWIKNYGLETVLGYSNWFKREITLQDLIDKLNRVKMYAEAQTFQDLLNKAVQDMSNPAPSNSNNPPATGNNTPKPGSKKLPQWVMPAAVIGGGAILLLLLNKKRR